MEREHALLVARGPAGEQEWVVGEEVLIGRDPACHVRLLDRQVSRRHASVRRVGTGYVVVDHDSKNGTWLNGVRVASSARLTDGDEVSIAARFKLFFVDAEATAPIAFTGRGLRLDDATMDVYVNGVPLVPVLSGLQFQLLRALYDAGGATVTRDEVVRRLWPESAVGVSEDAVDALVRRLRSRLGELDPQRQYVITVRGHGFRLEAD